MYEDILMKGLKAKAGIFFLQNSKFQGDPQRNIPAMRNSNMQMANIHRVLKLVNVYLRTKWLRNSVFSPAHTNRWTVSVRILAGGTRTRTPTPTEPINYIPATWSHGPA